MNCQDCREALSAMLDQEDPGLDEVLIQTHLVGCAGCRSYYSSSASLNREFRLRPAEDVPDLVGSVLASVETPRRPRPEWARYALFTVAMTQLLLALPGLVLGENLGASIHVARELGSWDAALAIGLLYAAWRPARAAGLLPFVAALAGTLAMTACLDVLAGRAVLLSETHHTLELIGLGLLVVLARPNWWSVRRATPEPAL